MRGISSGIAGAFCLFPVLAVADPSFECSISSSSQVETADCLANVEKTVDRTLAAALELATRSARELDEITGRELGVLALEQSQKAWTVYRDDQCEFVGTTFGGGSGTGIAIRSCRVELGRARIKELFDNLQ